MEASRQFEILHQVTLSSSSSMIVDVRCKLTRPQQLPSLQTSSDCSPLPGPDGTHTCMHLLALTSVPAPPHPPAMTAGITMSGRREKL